MTFKTSSLCLAPILRESAEAEAAKVAAFLQAEPLADSGTGETDSFRYTFRRKGQRSVELRVFPTAGHFQFSGEAYASW